MWQVVIWVLLSMMVAHAQINTGRTGTGSSDCIHKVLQHKNRIDICKDFYHDIWIHMLPFKSSCVDRGCSVLALYTHTMAPKTMMVALCRNDGEEPDKLTIGVILCV